MIPEKNNKSIDRRIPPTIESNLQSQQIKDISPKSHHSLKHRCPVVEDFPKSLKRPFPPPEPQDTTAKKQVEKSTDKVFLRIINSIIVSCKIRCILIHLVFAYNLHV